MHYELILRQYFGYEHFRGIQEEIIQSIGTGHDTLGLMPTGGGKSITFQVPALAQPGTCIVITPLIALMKDQVQALRRRYIKATAVYSGMTHSQIVTALENCILGNYKFLYISPERIATPLFQAKLRHMHVSFITVDEAHCISQWGHDFRPSYLHIADIRAIVPDVPVLALTASATPEVVEDITHQLKFRSGFSVHRMSFYRANLTYVVRHTANKESELIHILRSFTGSAIVYTRNRHQTHELVRFLNEQGITATNYHAGLPQVDKDERQDAWLNDRYRVMVATNAFGMGIDKPDVRLVLHFDIPDSPESYFQEAGRAGRDGLRAYAVLLHDGKDAKKLLQRVGETYPDVKYIRRVYEDLCCYLQMAMGDGTGVTREFDLAEFCRKYRHFPVQANNALILLSRTGLISYLQDEEVTSRLKFILSRDDLYRLNERPEPQEKIIHAMLREYTGLFSDYTYIDEHWIARATGLDFDTVYYHLRELSRASILHYIPRRRTNFITFVTRRVEQDEIVFPPHVLADRRTQYQRRITEMIQYVTTCEVCRSRYLLSYFGEYESPECGHCDICLANNGKTKEETDGSLRSNILRQLQSGPLRASDFDFTGYNRETFIAVVEEMCRTEEIILDDEQRFLLNIKQ